MFFGVAFRAFFAALFNRERAEAIRSALEGTAQDEQQRLTGGQSSAQPSDAPIAERSVTPAANRVAKTPVRSDAVTLLATLQREARLIDLVQEPLDQYSDAQVGAAARPCLTQCRSALKRMFDLRPLVDAQEGQSIELPAGNSPLRYQWVGEVSGDKRSGKLVHPGWEAARCELAQWTGEPVDANIIAPAQLEP
jgi:hypothetical protein